MNKTIFILLAVAVSSFAASADSDSVTVEVLAQSTQSWDGQVLPDYKAGASEVTILRIIIPPHTRLPLHAHPVINAGVLLRGQLTVVTENDDTLHLKAGQAIIEVVNTAHYGINEGDIPAEIIVFYAGVRNKPITIESAGLEK